MAPEGCSLHQRGPTAWWAASSQPCNGGECTKCSRRCRTCLPSVVLCGTGHAGGAQQHQQPASQARRGTLLKPTTLKSLGTGAAAAGRNAAAREALTACVVPPRQLASAVQGAALTVTGSTGQRVYCQLDAARPQAETSRPPPGAACRLSGGSVGGLLAQPLDALLDQLADRRRQVTRGGGVKQSQQPGSTGSTHFITLCITGTGCCWLPCA